MTHHGRRGFTLIELLVVVAVIAVLVSLLLPVAQSVRVASSRAISAHSLGELSVAGQRYLGEHENVFWRYQETSAEGTVWWFGFETAESKRRPEGERELDFSRGPLGPYAIASSGIKSDPAFLAFSGRLKPKYKNGNYGYGYNTLLASADDNPGQPRHALRAEHPAETVVFATCAQVNTFQPPATAANPLLEEFYMINDREVTVHFRHGGKALAAFLDGSVREMESAPDTIDRRMSAARVGRFAPVGSRQYLW